MNDTELKPYMAQIEEYAHSHSKDAYPELSRALFMAKTSAFLDGVSLASNLSTEDYKKLMEYTTMLLKTIN